LEKSNPQNRNLHKNKQISIKTSLKTSNPQVIKKNPQLHKKQDQIRWKTARLATLVDYQHCRTVWRLFVSKTVGALSPKPF